VRLLPHTGNEAEDKMAMVPILFCGLPLLILVLLIGGCVLWWFS
jgi:hypothetical protein